MDEIKRLLASAKLEYDASGGCPLDKISSVSQYCLSKLGSGTVSKHVATIGGKDYHTLKGGERFSRPYVPKMFISKPEAFSKAWDAMMIKIDRNTRRINAPASDVNAVLYTAVCSFAMCYDIWKPSSRKTPGTFFEILLGSVLGKCLPHYKRTKHVPLPEAVEGDGSDENVSTDIVLNSPRGKAHLVIPAKITTRERIVQPFAHQRILNSIFGEGTYLSVLMCVSEMQRDKETSANEIAVPGTVRLFQKHLAGLAGIYYLDPPTRYLREDVTSIVKVGSIGDFMTSRLAELTCE